MGPLLGSFMAIQAKPNWRVGWRPALMPLTSHPFVLNHVGILGPCLQACLTFSPPPRNQKLHALAFIDKLGLVQHTKHKSSSIHYYLQPDSDLHEEALSTIQHVKAHQDCNRPFSSLPLSAQLNIQVNNAANTAYTDDSPTCHTPLLPCTLAAISLGGKRVTAELSSVINLHYYTPILESRYCTKNGWTTAIFHSIDWESSEREYKCLSYGRRLASFKIQQGLWPTISFYISVKLPLPPYVPAVSSKLNHMTMCPDVMLHSPFGQPYGLLFSQYYAIPPHICLVARNSCRISTYSTISTYEISSVLKLRVMSCTSWYFNKEQLHHTKTLYNQSIILEGTARLPSPPPLH